MIDHPDGPDGFVQNASHWGAFLARSDGEKLAVRPHPLDPSPSALLGNIPSALDVGRVQKPAVRTGWLRDGPGPSSARGHDSYTEVSWDDLLELLSGELKRVYDDRGAGAVFGGSYGWSSAGRFHHAQSQVHRFLNGLGGYVRSVNTYSHGASSVIMPHVLGADVEVVRGLTDWPTIFDNTELIVAFGGIPRKNLGVASGGISRHRTPGFLDQLAERRIDLVNVSPLRADADTGPNVTWWPIRPASDVALMLGLMHTMFVEGLHDQEFLDTYCEGAERLRAYVEGRDGGTPKTAAWAAERCGVEAEQIRRLARDLVSRRSFVSVTWSLQRAQFGEQPPWAGVALAAIIGQIGLPGGGYGHGYGSMGDVGTRGSGRRLPTLSQGVNPISDYIPVARIADMLLDPGGEYEYNGERRTYPSIDLVYWAGGNPFHHHQDILRLRRAFARPDTIVVHEPFWTPMAKHADFVIPATTSLERNDLAAAHSDRHLLAMKQVVSPIGSARNDYDVFAALSARLGTGEAFTEGRSADEWIQHLYETWAGQHGGAETPMPSFESFWEAGEFDLGGSAEQRTFLSAFRDDPVGAALRTPSGRIELFSDTIDSFGYDDCPGHPTWLEPDDWLGSARADAWPLHLIANQPRTRLHSQLDGGAHSQASKVAGREPVSMHPTNAAQRDLRDGDVVRVFNDRGSCLAGVVIVEDIRVDCVQMATGAWFDPDDLTGDRPLCVHGNVNMLTADIGTSRLAQGSTGQHALVQIERYEQDLPPIRAYAGPELVRLPTPHDPEETP